MLKHIKPTVKAHPYLKQFQRKMRRFPTLAEHHISQLLHQAKYKFSKQQVFFDEVTKVAYIADFWVWECKIIIECDGMHHYNDEGQRLSDIRRDSLFSDAGIRTIRIPNRACISLNRDKLKNVINKGKVYW